MAYLPLSTANLPDPVIDPAQDKEPRDYFETFLYSGNGGGQQVGDVIKKPADTTTISDSLIFNDGDSAYLSRTPTSNPTEGKKLTISAWFKRGNLGGLQTLFSGNPDRNGLLIQLVNYTFDDRLYVYDLGAATGGVQIQSSRTFRDTSSWYHIFLSFDTTQATDSDRLKIYINGVQEDLTAYTIGAGANTYPAQNATIDFNTNGTSHLIGAETTTTDHWDGYIAEVHVVDGTAYDETDFGNFDANGIWIPKAVTGINYGNNGFYLDFSDNTSTTTLGEDQTANGNDWTLNNFATTDQVPDSPTNSYPIFSGSNRNSGTQLSEGNLEFRNTSGQIHNSAIATQRLPKQGKWYWEVKVITDSSPATNAIGVASASFDNTPTPSGAGNFFYNEGLGWYGNTGALFGPATYGDEVESGSVVTFGNNDIIGVEYDADEKTMYFRKNGTLIDYHYINLKDSAYDFLPATSAYGDLAGNGTRGNIINFGQKALYGTDGSGTLPTGFSLLTENNITVDDQNLESPDLVWIKSRSNSAHSHQLYDSVRGATKRIFSDDTGSELDAPNGLQSFNTNGFTVGSREQSNTAGDDYVAWCWKAGGSGVSNTDGDFAVTVSANTKSGFSIVDLTDPDTGASYEVGHGLDSPPEMFFIKKTNTTSDWSVYHKDVGNDKRLVLNDSGGQSGSSSVYFGSTTPTSSVVTIGSGLSTGDDWIMYCFHGVEGYSKFGSFSGNNSTDGPFIYLGFRPALFMVKCTNTTGSWYCYDTTRLDYNVMGSQGQPIAWDTAAGEDSGADASWYVDALSNGIKIRNNSGFDNGTNSFIYMAFAQNPFKYANAR